MYRLHGRPSASYVCAPGRLVRPGPSGRRAFCFQCRPFWALPYRTITLPPSAWPQNSDGGKREQDFRIFDMFWEVIKIVMLRWCVALTWMLNEMILLNGDTFERWTSGSTSLFCFKDKTSTTSEMAANTRMLSELRQFVMGTIVPLYVPLYSMLHD